MSRSELAGRDFDGYRLLEVVASGDDEVLYLAERVRDGGRVWVRTARVADPEVHLRLQQRYEAEMKASRRLASVGAVLSVRETIRVDGATGLVTDVPRGRSLNDMLASRSGPWPLKDVLPWFRRLTTAMEAAHEEDAAHGSLQGRAVYIDDSGRVTVCGLAQVTNETARDARLCDVRALAALLYRASSGRPPTRGFPDTGTPASPEQFVPDYPGTLARFLVRRLADGDDDDPVVDAGTFRRSIDALEVDPAFRRAARLAVRPDEDVSSPDIRVERVKRQRLRMILLHSGIIALFVAVSVLATFMAMQVRVDQARRDAASAAEAARAQRTRPEPLAAGMEVWHCLHRPFREGEVGTLTAEQTDACLRQSPSTRVADLEAELSRIKERLDPTSIPDDFNDSLTTVYESLFRRGADTLERAVGSKLEKRLPVDGLERWIATNRSGERDAVLLTLALRETPAGIWARSLLGRLAGGGTPE